MNYNGPPGPWPGPGSPPNYRPGFYPGPVPPQPGFQPNFPPQMPPIFPPNMPFYQGATFTNGPSFHRGPVWGPPPHPGMPPPPMHGPRPLPRLFINDSGSYICPIRRLVERNTGGWDVHVGLRIPFIEPPNPSDRILYQSTDGMRRCAERQVQVWHENVEALLRGEYFPEELRLAIILLMAHETRHMMRICYREPENPILFWSFVLDALLKMQAVRGASVAREPEDEPDVEHLLEWYPEMST